MQRTHPERGTPAGEQAGDFVLNGLPPVPGAPYADPCIELARRRAGAARLERTTGPPTSRLDAIFNKAGWHFPQQRMISLWDDVVDHAGRHSGRRSRCSSAPTPASASSTRLANLVPNVYELDDFQVRTPTDILGQHIHLVKFDVTSSDGAANGFNYEDGTFSPDEVTERINAFNNGEFRPTFETPPQSGQIEPKFIKFFGADPGCATGDNAGSEKCACQLVSFTDDSGETHFSVQGGRWCGAQATFQRWYVDPQLTNSGADKTMRTVFTHDHFSPSTHQQTGLYAGLVAEPFEIDLAR